MTTQGTEPLDDETIILGMLYKEENALRVLINAYSQKVLGYLKKNFSTLTDIDREEVFNRMLKKAWDNPDKFDVTKAKLSTWLILIARRCALSMIKSEKKHAAACFDVYETFEPQYEHKLFECPDNWRTDTNFAWKVDELEKFILSLTGFERSLAEEDLLVGDAADSKELVIKYGKTLDTIYSTRSKIRKKFRELIESQEHARSKRKDKP